MDIILLMDDISALHTTIVPIKSVLAYLIVFRAVIMRFEFIFWLIPRFSCTKCS